MKFHGILPDMDIEIINHNMNAVDTDNRTKQNLKDTVSNVFFLYQDYIRKLSIKEKIEAASVLALTFNALLDPEISPFAAYHIRTALDCFNNNILTKEQFATWDELNGCDIFERMERIWGAGNEKMADTKMQ
jgi:hypothetical protein